MACYWNEKQSSNYADQRNNDRYIIFPDDINAENGELGFCETIFQAIETALNILDKIDLAFLAFNIAKKIKEFIKLLRLLLQEYRKDPNKYRKVLKDLIIQLKELIRELMAEKPKKPSNEIDIDLIINALERIIKWLEQLTGIGCTLLNRAFIHPIDNQQYSTLCAVGRDGIENWLINNITSPFGLIKWKPTDLNYDRIILSRKNILTRIFDEVCTCIEFGNPPSFTPTPTPTNTCIPCRVTQIPVYDLECKEVIEGTIEPVIYKLNQNGQEIPVSIVDMVDCTENPDVLEWLTCTLTTCTPTTPTTSTLTTSTNINTRNPINLDCIEPGTEHCYQQAYQNALNFYFRPATGWGSQAAPVGSPYTEWSRGSRIYTPELAEAVRSRDPDLIENKQVFNNDYPTYQHHYIESTDWIAKASNLEYYIFNEPLYSSDIDYVGPFINAQCHKPRYGISYYAFRFRLSGTITTWVVIEGEDTIWWWTETTTTIFIDNLGCLMPVTNTPSFISNSPSSSVSSNSPTSSISNSISSISNISSISPTPITLSPTETNSNSSSISSTITPSNSDPGCDYGYTWDRNSGELCITNNGNVPLLIDVTSYYSTTINDMYEINPNETICNTYGEPIRLKVIDYETGDECGREYLI